MVSMLRFAVMGAFLTLLPALAHGKAIASPAELAPADFWVWIEGTNGALPRVEARDSVPVSVSLENPVIGGHGSRTSSARRRSTTSWC